MHAKMHQKNSNMHALPNMNQHTHYPPAHSSMPTHPHPHQMPAPIDGMVAEWPGYDELATQQQHGGQGLCSAVHLLEGHAASNIPHNSTVQPWGGGGGGGKEVCSVCWCQCVSNMHRLHQYMCNINTPLHDAMHNTNTVCEMVAGQENCASNFMNGHCASDYT